MVIGLTSYPTMPGILAVHHGAKGVPDRLAAKSIGTAFSLVFVQIGVTALLVGIAAAIFRSRPDIDPAHPVASARAPPVHVPERQGPARLAAMIDLGMLGSSC
ncbi:hypothetical protein AHiyo6_14930 [Arthrobacter sp. Hiyo6]|nr:hypothetical protein AHiyo6_14930 [Arthrobacter sp. Hiyo6]